MNRKIVAATFAIMVVVATQALAAQGGGGGGAGGAGGAGGGGVPPTPNPLPTAAPAANVIFRESFGPGLGGAFSRPQGGSASVRSVIAGTSIAGFWAEWPGNRSTAWSATNGAWIFAFASMNPFETLATAIQPFPFNGIAFSDWSNDIVDFPDLIVPFRGAATTYMLSAELFPAFLPGSSVGIGLTGSGVLTGNLTTSGQIWVRLSQVDPFDGVAGQYDVMSGSTVLASGPVELSGFNQVAITVDPVAQTVDVMLDGIDLGTWATPVTPLFIAIEGQGWADDVVVTAQ
jgi:hypothetical protein